MFVQLEFRAPPLARVLLLKERGAGGIADFKLAPVVINLGRHVHHVGKVVRVFQRRVAARVGGAQPRVVERGAELRGGIAFLPRDIRALQGEIKIAQRAEETSKRVVVSILRHAVVLGRGVVFLVEQFFLPVAVGERTRQEQLHAIGEGLAQRHAGLVSVELPVLDGALRAVDLPALAGHDVDHAEERVVAIEHRTGAADDFHAVDQVHVEDEGRIYEGAVGQVVIHAMPVDQHEDAAVEVAEVDAPRAEEGVVPIVRHLKALQALQRVAQGTVAVLLEIVRRHDGDRRGRFRGLLLELGGGIDFGNLEVHQSFEGQFRQIGGLDPRF